MLHLCILVITAIMAFQTSPIIQDYDHVFSYKLPTESDWSLYLSENEGQITNGSRETEFLNACYRGGWNRCLSAFQHGYFEWDFYWIKENDPERMGGNMVDTDRVAGQRGWKDCTDRLKLALKTEQPESIKHRIYKISPNWITFSIAILFGISWIVVDILFNHKKRNAAKLKQ